MGSCTYLSPGTLVIAPPTTGGWSVWISTILLMSEDGPQQQLVAEFGATAAWLVTAQTCLSSLATPLTPAATGWAAKLLSVCKRGRPGPVCLPTTGRLRIGSISIKAIPIL